MENNEQEIAQLCERIERLEHQVAHLVALFERATGMLIFVKWTSALVMSGAALFAFLSNHFTMK